MDMSAFSREPITADQQQRIDARAADEQAKGKEREARFCRQRGVKRFKNSSRNLAAMLNSGGANLEAIEKALDALDPLRISGICAPLFDHGNIYGCNRTPHFLIGAPYEINEEHLWRLDLLRAIGLDVMITSHSFYGFGTVHIEVCDPNYDFYQPDPGSQSS